MTTSIGQQPARIVSDGFHLFAKQPTHVLYMMIPGVFLIEQPLHIDAIEVFRTFRIGGGKMRHDKSNVAFELFEQQTLLLNDIFLTPEFGISVVCDTDLARFDFEPAPSTSSFHQTFQFKTMDGFVFEPRCNFKIL